MFDEIDPRSPTPLYDQIAGRVRLAVAAGDLRPGIALPSVRRLAARLGVNPATVVQAYRALEADGFVEMRQGTGTFIRDVAPERRTRERDDEARRLAQRMLSEAARLGLPGTALCEALKRELKGEAA